MFRSRKSVKKYKNNASADCPFCDVKPRSKRVKQTGKHTYVIENIFPYDWWDLCAVDDHLLITPKKHTDSLAKLEDEVLKEYLATILKYEKAGYTIYARPPKNKRKTVIHQHTHLIKTDNKPRKFLLFLKKPYFTIYK